MSNSKQTCEFIRGIIDDELTLISPGGGSGADLGLSPQGFLLEHQFRCDTFRFIVLDKYFNRVWAAGY